METNTDNQEEGASHGLGAEGSITKIEELYYQHVPKLVRQGLLEKIQKEEKISGDSRQVFASVLFADISGFTQLSSRLSAEELQMHINEYFTKLLGIVEENAGDVIKFCGDAVMIMWTVPLNASDDVKAAAVLMSAVCALQMLEECGEYRRSRRDSCTTASAYPHSSTVAPPTRHRLSVSRAATQASLLTMALVATSDSPTKSSPVPHRASHTTPLSPTNATVELSLHCGISCGTVHCMTLGDTQRLEFLISGEVVSQMGAAEACAKAGEVCVHPTAFERIRNKLAGEAVYPAAAPPVKKSQTGQNIGGVDENEEPAHAEGEEMADTGQHAVKECRPPPLVLGGSNRGNSVGDCRGDLVGSKTPNFLSGVQEIALNTAHSTKSSPHAGSSARVHDGCSAATDTKRPDMKQPDMSPDAPIAFLLTGRLAEEFSSSPNKQRSRRSVRIATAGSVSTTTTISAGHLSERRPRRSGSIISFHLPSERIVESPSTDLDSLAPTEKLEDDSLVMSDAEAEERAAEVKAQKKYALHERGLFPTDESAAILEGNIENTCSASSKALSADSAKYLEALARELTGNSTQLVRTRQKISAADVVPQPATTEEVLPHERQTSVATSRHGSLLTFLRGSKVYSSTTPALNCSDTVDIQERAKPGIGRHSVSTSPTRTKRGSIVLNATVSAKDVPSAGDAVGVIVRAPSIRQSVHRGVQRHLSALFSTTRSSLGFILPFQSVGLVGYSSAVVSESSTTAASSAHSLHDVKENLKEGTVTEPPLTGRQRARTASASFDETCEPGASAATNPSSPPLGSKLDEVTSVPLNNDSAQLASSRKKLTVTKIKRKLHFGTDEHVCAVRALQEDSNKPPKRQIEDVRDFNSSDNSLFERDQSENKVNSAPPVKNEAHELRLLQELRRFTHETAARAIDSNTISFLSELRDVAVVFMQILDLEADFSSGLYHKPQRVLCVILKLLRQFGGSLRQFVVDDKGCVAIGCFGLSGSSNQNNCVQAVDFAVSVRTLLHTLGCRSAVGITLGRVYCGLVGAAGRCEYAVMGASVNLAARLMAACAKALALMVANSVHSHAKEEHEPSSAHRITFPNTHHSSTPLSVRRGRSSDPAHLSEQSGVLVDAAVHELAQHQFQFHSQEPIVAKGYSEPVKVFAAVRKRALSLLASAPVDAIQEPSQRSHSVKHHNVPPGCAEMGASDAVSRRSDTAVEETKSSESICLTSDLPLPLLEREKLANEVIHHLLGLKDASRNKYAGGQNCVLIEGPGGVGCSRLLEHILSSVTAALASSSRTDDVDVTQVAQVVKVQCDPAHQYVPYNLIRALLFKAIGIQDEANLTASFTSSSDKPHFSSESTRACAASQKMESWCAARVPGAFSLVDAFKLCHPSLTLQEVLLFHHKVRVSSEKHGSAALQASQLAAYCTALCSTPMLCFLPLLNDAFGTNMRHSGAQLCCGTPLEKVMEQVSVEVHDLMVSVVLQVLLLCTLGCNVDSAVSLTGTSTVCYVLAADELQHADAESINLISNALTCMARLSSPSSSGSSAAALQRGCFIATYCDNTSTLLSEAVVTTTQTGVSAASLPVTKPVRQQSILPLSTCDCVEDLFSPVAIGENSLTHEQLIKQLRSRAKVITVPRLSHTGVRTLVQHILGLRQWTWLVDNAHLALGTATRTAESAENSHVDNSTISVRSRVARTTPPRKRSIPLPAALGASPPRVPVRRGSSYHSPIALTSSPERNERFLRTTDCVAEDVCMAMQSAAGVPNAALAGGVGTVRNNRTRQPPRGPSLEQSIVQLLFTLSQNGLPRCVIEIATSLRDAIATNTFTGIHRLSVVVRRNKLLLEVLDQLSGMEVVVLKAAAVIGATFDIPSLRAALVGMDMQRCAETVVLCGALVKLTAVGLIRSVDTTSSGSNSSSSSAESVAHSGTSSVPHVSNTGLSTQTSGGLFEFTEGATQLAVYDLMLEAQRALAHCAIGAHLEHSLSPEREELSGPEHLQMLLQIAHHYRHSNNTLKKMAVLTRVAEYYTSSNDASNAMAVYCELVSVALGTSMDDLISICTDNELSALTVLYNAFLPRAVVNSEDAMGDEDDIAAAAQLRQQLFHEQVAVLDPSVLNKRPKKNKAYESREHKWWVWCKSAAKGSSQKILPEKSVSVAKTAKQAGLVSSLQQDTADAQQLMDIRQELSSMTLSELYTQRRLLLRALHNTTSTDRSSSVLAKSNAYRTICTTCPIAVRGEIAAVSVSLSDVVDWVGKLVTLSSRADQEEERIEYATLALHLTEHAAIPNIPPSATTNPLPQDHSGSAKSTHTLNTITTMYTPHTLHHMHSMNTTHSAVSQAGACNIRPFSTHAPSPMDGEESEHSQQSSTHDATACPVCHSNKVEAVEVCCGWWPSRHSAAENSTKVPSVTMGPAPVALSDSARISTAVDKVLLKHFPAPILDTPHSHNHSHNHSHGPYCATHKSALSPEDTVLKALLHPAEVTNNNACVSDGTITLAKYLLSTGNVLAVLGLVEPLTSTSTNAVATVTALALLSRAFRAIGDMDSTTLCIRRALHVYTKLTSFGNGKYEDIARMKYEVLHMCASHLAMTGNYATAVKQLDMCVDLSTIIGTSSHSSVDLLLQKSWCLILNGDLTVAKELLVSLQHTLTGPDGVSGGDLFAEENTVTNYEYDRQAEKVRELMLLLDFLQTDSTDPLVSNAASGHTGDSTEGSESHQHIMSVLLSFSSAIHPVSTVGMGYQRSLLSIKAQLAHDIPARLRPAPNMSVLEWVSQQDEYVCVESTSGDTASSADSTTFALLHQLCTTTHYTTLSTAVTFCMSVFTNMKDYTNRIAYSTTHMAIAEHNTICEVLVLLALSMLRCDTLVTATATGLNPLYIVLNVQFELVLATFYERFYGTDQSTVYSQTYATVFAYVSHITKRIRLKPLPARKSSILGIDAVSALVQSTTRLSRQNASVGRNATTEQCKSNSGNSGNSSNSSNSMSGHYLGNGRNSGCLGPGLNKQKMKLWKAVLCDTSSNNVNHCNTHDSCVEVIEDFLSLESKSEKINNEHCDEKNMPKVMYKNPVYKQFRDAVSSRINALTM